MTKRQEKTAIEVYRRLHEVWHYAPETGVFTRIERNAVGPAASEHGFINVQGYRTLQIDNVAYPAARLAWLYMKAKWPERDIRVRNGDKLDLRWANLHERPARFPAGQSVDQKLTLTRARLREVLEYSPLTGEFVWLKSSPRAPAGAVAGVLMSVGYRSISVDGQKYLAHRLAWFYSYGVWPAHQIDHINGDRSDNRLDNLREATPGENSRNQRVRPTNKLGLKGVSPYRGRFKAQIIVNYQIVPLGVYRTPEEAHAAYCAAAKKYHGDFANNGGPLEPSAP